MSESNDGGDVVEQEDASSAHISEGAELVFGNYTVLSPGVEIVLDGRTVSAPTGD